MMKRVVFVLVCLLFNYQVYGQSTKSFVKKVTGKYALVKIGTPHHAQIGDQFKIHEPANFEKHALVEVIKVRRSLAAVKILRLFRGYTIRVGDPVFISEEETVDQLFSDLTDDSDKTQWPRNDIKYDSDNFTPVNRKGFIIGGGIGIGGLAMKFSGGGASATNEEGTIQTDFKIGYAPSNSLEIFYISKVAWWSSNSITFINGLSSIGFLKYTNTSQATGFFFSGGLGLSSLDAPFEANSSASTGFGLFGGIGYEFTKHWSFQADLLLSNIEEAGVTLNTVGLRAGLNVTAY